MTARNRNRKINRKNRNTTRREKRSNALPYEALEPRQLLATSPLGLQLVGNSTGAGFVLQGSAGGNLTGGGTGIVNLGDINGDGFGDMAVGSPGANTVDVIYGKAPGVPFPTTLTSGALGSHGFTISGLGTGPNGGFFGRSVAAVGDFNGDLIPDFAIGDPDADPTAGGLPEGAAYVVYGRSPTAPSAVLRTPFSNFNVGSLNVGTGFVVNGFFSATNAVSTQGPNGLGISISAGDVDGNGLSDLVIGASDIDPDGGGNNEGVVYVLFGERRTNLDGADGTTDGIATLAEANMFTGARNGFRIRGLATGPGNEEFGFSTAVGNLDGDGMADLVVGAQAFNQDADANLEGAAYILFGKNLPLLGTAPANGLIGLIPSDFAGTSGAGFAFQTNYQFFGLSSSGVGGSVHITSDINGDGLNLDEVLIGEPTNGFAFVLFSDRFASLDGVTIDGTISPAAPTTFNGANGYQISLTPVANLDSLGFSLGSTDVSGDGTPDLLLGAQTSGANGAVYVLFGESLASLYGASGGVNGRIVPTNVNGTNGFVVNGFQANSSVGNTVSAVGDVNNDGFQDFVVGAINANPLGAVEGAAYVVFGPANVTFDYGDAPGSYELNGAAVYDPAGHRIEGNNIALGSAAARDAETVTAAPGIVGGSATLDDTTATDDEDGVFNADGSPFGTQALVAGLNSIRVTATQTSFLDAFIDFNADGDFADAGEKIFNAWPLAAGSNLLTFNIAAAQVAATTFSRFRVSSTGGLNPTGLFSDGEVEDYAIGVGTSVFAPLPSVAEGPTTPGTFVVSRQGNFATPSVLSFNITGTAIAGTDYNVTGTTTFVPATGSRHSYHSRQCLVSGCYDYPYYRCTYRGERVGHHDRWRDVCQLDHPRRCRGLDDFRCAGKCYRGWESCLYDCCAHPTRLSIFPLPEQLH